MNRKTNILPTYYDENYRVHDFYHRGRMGHGRQAEGIYPAGGIS